MKRQIYILAITASLFVVCNLCYTNTNSISASRIPPERDILERMKFQKQNIDTLFNQSKDKLIVLTKLTDNNTPTQIKDGNIPDNLEVTFNILNDSLGKILTVSEFPFSKSGDWNIILTHYFDKDGNTFAFERQTNFFNSICTEGVAYETLTEFYNRDLELIGKMYKLVDGENNNLQRDSCNFPYDYEYKVSPSIDKYLKANKIKKGW